MLSKHKQLYNEAIRSLAGGVSAATRMDRALGHPFYVDHGKGAMIYDIEGRDFIDLAMSNGLAVFGHGFGAEICDKARASTWSYESEESVGAADLLSTIVPCAERVRFALSGTEAVVSALRIARAFTGKEKFVKFAGHFHGNADPLQFNWTDLGEASFSDGTLPLHPESIGSSDSSSEQILIAPFNDCEAIARIFQRHEGEIAALILEPTSIHSGCISANREFLELVRALCFKCGSLLIYDEIFCGFRERLGSAVSTHDISPDLVTFGKIIGGGLPVSAIGGRSDVMSVLSEVPGVFLSGAHAGSQIFGRAVIKAMEALLDESHYRLVNNYCELWSDWLSKCLLERDIPVRIERCGDRFGLHLFHDPETRISRPWFSSELSEAQSRLSLLAYQNGIYLRPQFHHGISVAHGPEILEEARTRLPSLEELDIGTGSA